ncbi:MAG: MFS transporter [Peptococcaceae bacterium]|nr:MFS transporter [Peptococcaceae bacterium]
MKGNLKNWQIILFSMGGESYMIVFALTTWIMYGYCPPEGKGVALVPLATFTTVTTLARILEAVLNPVVGVISDNTRTRWGRRIPFIFTGAVVMALCTVLISRPPVDTGIDRFNVIYFSLIYIVMTVSSMVMYQPMLALTPEITADSNERIKITSISLFMGVIIGLINLTQGPAFEKLGFSNMTTVFGMLALLLALGPVVSINEKRDVIIRENVSINGRKINLIKGIKDILGNRIFILFALANSIQMLAFITITAVVPYLLTEIAGKRPKDAAILGLFSIAGMLLSIPLANILAKKTCKKKVFARSVLVNGVFFGLMTLILPLAPRSSVYNLLLLFAFAYSFFFIFTNTVKNPMLADIILFDSQLTGERKEALYIGTHGLIFRIIDSTNLAVTGILFSFFGYSAAKPLGIYLIFPVCAVLNLLSYFIIRHYPLDDQGGFLAGYGEKYRYLVDRLRKRRTAVAGNDEACVD